jgi:hypothetical protein
VEADAGVEDVAGLDENGFNEAVPAGFDEKGFEKGFAGVVVLAPFVAPKSDSPILGCGFSSCFDSGFGVLLCATRPAPAPFAMRTLRIPRTLPSFLLHVFLRQLQIYSRRSCPGNCSGRSPLSSMRRLSSPLHTLHFASAPEGAVLSSNHVCTPFVSFHVYLMAEDIVPVYLQDAI